MDQGILTTRIESDFVKGRPCWKVELTVGNVTSEKVWRFWYRRQADLFDRLVKNGITPYIAADRAVWES